LRNSGNGLRARRRSAGKEEAVPGHPAQQLPREGKEIGGLAGCQKEGQRAQR
jgi:hypothetical protein